MDSNLNRKAFQQDTQAKATQMALLARPEEILDLQRRIDEDTRDILCVAGARMDILLRDKRAFPAPEVPSTHQHQSAHGAAKEGPSGLLLESAPTTWPPMDHSPVRSSVHSVQAEVPLQVPAQRANGHKPCQ